jgi:superfamily I DNA and/or RNA helicase
MDSIGHTISTAIKEGKWIAIEYSNSQKEHTSFWCAVYDIDIERKTLHAQAFNYNKINENNSGLIDKLVFLSFEKISSAFIVAGTTYAVPNELINKIESNILRLQWLDYSYSNENIISYLKDCVVFDTNPYVKEAALIQKIDEQVLIKNGVYKLSFAQLETMAQKFDNLNNLVENKTRYIQEYILNDLSIVTNQGFYVVAYRKVLLDPSTRELTIGKDIYFNYTFSADDKDSFVHNLQNYLDIGVDEFLNLYHKNRSEAVDMLKDSLRKGETLDSRPYFFKLIHRFISSYLEQLNGVETQLKEDNSVPLLSLFGGMSTNRLGKKDKFEIVTLNEKVNTSQLRVIYNALKHPVTIVQGPPGTGKTQSILNLLISALFNEKTVLMASNNNKPLNDIYDKLINLNYRNKVIPLPVIRLGSNEYINQALDRILEIEQHYRAEFDRPDEEKLLSKHSQSQTYFQKINQMIKLYEEKENIKENVNALQAVIERFDGSLKTVTLNDEYNKLSKRLRELDLLEIDNPEYHVKQANTDLQMWLYYSSLSFYKHLFNSERYKELIAILNIKEKNERVQNFNKYLSNQDNLRRFIKIFPIIITTNASAFRIGNPEPEFDIVVIDEAAQCPIGPALFSIVRGKKMVLVGDQNQLKPVISLNRFLNEKLMRKYDISETQFNYIENSILRLAQHNDTISPFILLNQHYRCAKKIINFSNYKYYKKQLKLMRENDREDALVLLDLSRNMMDAKQIERNTSLSEISAIIDHIQTNNVSNYGIITPFRRQAELFKEVLKDKNMDAKNVGTIHSFQGDEKKVIYFSPAITRQTSKKTFGWIKNNVELINVAVTRAQDQLIIPCNVDRIHQLSENKPNDLCELVDYVKDNGITDKLTMREDKSIVNAMNFRQYNTKKEEELFDTIFHFTSVNNSYIVERQRKMSDVLENFTNTRKFDFGTKSTFDFVLYNKTTKLPVLIIELNGHEHYTNAKRIELDELKKQICRDNNIKLLTIENDYSRRYIFVRDQIIKLLV